MREWRHRKLRKTHQVHTAGTSQSQDLNPPMCCTCCTLCCQGNALIDTVHFLRCYMLRRGIRSKLKSPGLFSSLLRTYLRAFTSLHLDCPALFWAAGPSVLRMKWSPNHLPTFILKTLHIAPREFLRDVIISQPCLIPLKYSHRF
jgi:hypothetical protein